MQITKRVSGLEDREYCPAQDPRPCWKEIKNDSIRVGNRVDWRRHSPRGTGWHCLQCVHEEEQVQLSNLAYNYMWPVLTVITEAPVIYIDI